MRRSSLGSQVPSESTSPRSPRSAPEPANRLGGATSIAGKGTPVAYSADRIPVTLSSIASSSVAQSAPKALAPCRWRDWPSASTSIP